MGRSLFGNSVSAAVTKLTRTLGNLSGTIKDSSTTSNQVAIPGGGYWAYDATLRYSNNYSFRQGTVAEQRMDWGASAGAGVLQDALSDYTYVQGPGYYSGSYDLTGVVYDAALNSVYNWRSNTPPFTGNLIAIRLHNSALYFISTNSTTLYVTKVALPSGTVTSYTYTLGGSGWSGTYDKGLVFNWPVNGKFWIYLSPGSSAPYNNYILTFDLTTNAIAQFGVTLTRTSSDYINQSFAMHVDAAGTAVSVAAYSSPQNAYGTLIFTTTTASFSQASASGHWYWPRSGGYYILGSSLRWKAAVTTIGVIDFGQVPSGTVGSTYYNAVGCLIAGQPADYGDFAGAAPNNYPINQPAPHPSQTLRDQVMLTYNGSAGTYPVAVASGSKFTFGSRRSSAYVVGGNWGATTSKLSDQFVTGMNLNTTQSTGMYLQGVVLANSSRSYTYTFASNITAQNSWSNYGDQIGATSFITSTGKFFSFNPYNSQSSQGISQTIIGQLPVFTETTGKTYNVTVIGGGAPAAGGGSDSSSFEGFAAASGNGRDGFVAGSVVFTSGPSRGTGGTGYGEDAWGQGEDATAANNYGGGSGYVTLGTVQLAAGTTYPYKAGLGPQYGKQGAILLLEA